MDLLAALERRCAAVPAGRLSLWRAQPESSLLVWFRFVFFF